METPDDKLGEIAKDIEVIQSEADTYTIQSQQDVAVATEFLVKVKGRAKRIEELRQFFVKPLNDQAKAINERFKASLKPLEEIEAKVKRSISDFTLEQERKRQEEERKLQEQHAKEMAKQEKQAEKTGEDFVPSAAPTIAAPSGPVRSSSGTASTPKVWKFEVVDPTLVPRDYLEVNESLIRKAVNGGTRDIPGVRIYQDVDVRVRANG